MAALPGRRGRSPRSPDSGCQRQRLSFIVEALRQPEIEKS
jgi:hypothetical protein